MGAESNDNGELKSWKSFNNQERKNVLDELLMERYDLAKNRICEICTEKSAQPDFEDFFKRMAEFLKKTAVILERQTTSIRESWNMWDVIATLGVVVLCALFYAYFW